MSGGVRAASATDVGRVRNLNEDALFVGDHLWVVADGMGGHAAGDVASRIAIDVLRDADRPGLSVADVMDAVTTASERIAQHGHDHPDAHGLGTTITGVAEVVSDGVPGWAVFNVGDSRTYHLGTGGLRQVTVDHSEVQALVDAGVITREQARTHGGRNVITRALGSTTPPDADVTLLPRVPGERFLITSDGLHNDLTDAELADGASHPDLDAGVAALVDLALARGGRDNITVVLLEVADA